MNQDELCDPDMKTQANNISANGRLGTQILAMICFHGKEFGELHICQLYYVQRFKTQDGMHK